MGCSPEDLPEAMNNREKWQERVRDNRAGGTTWWWWIFIMYWTFFFIWCSIHLAHSKYILLLDLTNLVILWWGGVYLTDQKLNYLAVVNFHTDVHGRHYKENIPFKSSKSKRKCEIVLINLLKLKHLTLTK